MFNTQPTQKRRKTDLIPKVIVNPKRHDSGSCRHGAVSWPRLSDPWPSKVKTKRFLSVVSCRSPVMVRFPLMVIRMLPTILWNVRRVSSTFSTVTGRSINKTHIWWVSLSLIKIGWTMLSSWTTSFTLPSLNCLLLQGYFLSFLQKGKPPENRVNWQQSDDV